MTSAEVAARQRLYGPNALPRAALPGPLILLFRQFRNPLVYLLVVATGVSLLVGEALDALFIAVVLLFNAAIGTFQDWRAQKSAAELDRLIQHRAIVRRDDKWSEVAATELVPGDIVRIERGVQVGGDLRLLSGTDLLLDESLLTGESVGVAKDPAGIASETVVADRSNLLYAGTTVLAGRGIGVVVETGLGTEIGRIAETLARGDVTLPPLMRQLERFSRVIGIATILLIALIAGAQALQGTPLVTVFLVAIALAVAAIPEGLPIAITVALTIAINRMHRRQVIVRSMPAVEGLGACTLIASDKTGTLTCNELTVKTAIPFIGGEPAAVLEISGEGYRPEGAMSVTRCLLDADPAPPLQRMVQSAALCNEAVLRFTADGTEHLGDTVDVAFLVLASKLGIETEALRDRLLQTGVVPYEPERRYAAAFTRELAVATDGDVTAHVKGAAEVIGPMCTGVQQRRLLDEADRLAGEGYRVLAVARGTVDASLASDAAEDALHGLEFLGLVGLIDPVRPEVPAAIAQCREAGISVRMITGDHPQTALAIARQLGLASSRTEVATESELKTLGQHPEAFDRLVASKSVFARVDPFQKLAIVGALRRAGHVVAVTGDGVNDAPALNAADIGVAMGRSGTDVARGAADLILIDDNFASIVAGIEEGRIAYDNIRKLIFLLIATGLGEIVLFLLAIPMGLPAPMFAVQLLWLNLVTNGIQDIALAFEKGEPGIGSRRPRPPTEPLFNKRMLSQVAVSGIYMGLMSFVAYDWFLGQGMAEDAARNLVLLLMVLFENAHALNARSERQSILHMPLSANWFLVAAVVGAQLLHVFAMFTPGLSDVLHIQPISIFDWILVAALAASLVLVMEVFKRLTNHLFNDV